MMYNPQIHNRQSLRLKGYDYSKKGLYFITIVTQDRAMIFGEIKDGEMILNKLGKIAEEEWIKSIEIRNNITLHEYIIMPNHMHGIIQINFKKENLKENQKEKEDFRGGDSDTGVLQYAPSGISPSEISSSENSPSGNSLSKNSISKFSPDFKSPSQTIGAIIRGYKGATTKRIKELHYKDGEKLNIDLSKSIWQRNYWDIIINNNNAYQNISNYIINNPKKWEEDKFKQS